MNRKIALGKYQQAVGRALQAQARRFGDAFTLKVGERLVVKGIAMVLLGMRESQPRRAG